MSLVKSPQQRMHHSAAQARKSHNNVFVNFLNRKTGDYTSQAMILWSTEDGCLRISHTPSGLQHHLVASFDPGGLLFAGFEGKPCVELRIVLNQLGRAVRSMGLGEPNYFAIDYTETKTGYGKVWIDPFDRVLLNVGRMSAMAINADREEKGQKPYIF